MASSADDDSLQNLILGLLFGLIALVIFLLVGIVIWHKGHSAKPAKSGGAPVAAMVAPAAAAVPPIAVVTETVTVTIPDGASVNVGANGVVAFYFATGSADLAPGAAEALAAVIKGVQGGRKAVISGYHDTTGDAAVNEQLAKKRAEMVRDVLTGLGVPAAKVDLQKPGETAGSGNNAEARRVEVKLVD
ncbi:outer membrane protein OmpA-like peptidoglycan-associated protein [Variovorax sp. GrIS 2.14]|uniref:OmpA family protein n=1 Tax=Variovorax sp. GrIS 2.14 TaxID=3071709 RepID=UPI0019A1C6C4|nr:OmpA family protein [Variovorax sp.]